MKDFLDIIENRKSCRSFKEKRITRELVEKIIEVATFAPTNCNQQLWNFIAIDDRSTFERLVREAASSTILRRVPLTIVITYDGWNYKEALQGASLALGHIILAAEYYGLATGPMNSYGSDTQVKRILGIPKKEIVCCFVNIGYPDDRSQKTTLVPRKEVGEVLHWGHFTERPTPPFTYNPDDWTLENLRSHQKHYCRKTFLGKEMDIMSQFERDIVQRTLKSQRGPIVDIFSYDGNYLREFPNVPVESVGLNQETVDYTRASADLYATINKDRFTYSVYNEHSLKLSENFPQTISLIYKAERLPSKVLDTLFHQIYQTLSPNGDFIIIARKKNLFLSFFFFMLKRLFGADMRKTGIYNFFGPYRPISMDKTIARLHSAGFRNVEWNSYFPFPPFYEQVYQMFLQYRKSEGSSYLHRDHRENVISKLLTRINRIQASKKFKTLGSVVVIRAKKDVLDKV